MYNLKDTVGSTLASAGVPNEAIKDVFHHSSLLISEKYIAPVKQDTINAIETLKNFH